MNKSTLKSIGAILSGFLFVIVISIVTDMILTRTGLMKHPFDLNSSLLIGLVVFYRSLYGTLGAYLTARLAPDRPLRHSLIGGAIGFIISIAGAIVMWDTPPHWYAISLILTTLPCAWLGGFSFIMTTTRPK